MADIEGQLSKRLLYNKVEYNEIIHNIISSDEQLKFQLCDNIIMTPMNSSTNTDSDNLLHTSLRQFFDGIMENITPVIMIVGVNNSGNLTLCENLQNYIATDNKRNSLLFNMDMNEREIKYFGEINSTSSIIDNDKLTVTYNFGPNAKQRSYQQLISRLVKTSRKYYDNNNVGIMISACGFDKFNGYELLIHTIKEFKVNGIFVIGQQKLYEELLNDTARFVNIYYLPNTSGIITRSQLNFNQTNCEE